MTPSEATPDPIMDFEAFRERYIINNDPTMAELEWGMHVWWMVRQGLISQQTAFEMLPAPARAEPAVFQTTPVPTPIPEPGETVTETATGWEVTRAEPRP